MPQAQAPSTPSGSVSLQKLSCNTLGPAWTSQLVSRANLPNIRTHGEQSRQEPWCRNRTRLHLRLLAPSCSENPVHPCEWRKTNTTRSIRASWAAADDAPRPQRWHRISAFSASGPNPSQLWIHSPQNRSSCCGPCPLCRSWGSRERTGPARLAREPWSKPRNGREWHTSTCPSERSPCNSFTSFRMILRALWNLRKEHYHLPVAIAKHYQGWQGTTISKGQKSRMILTTNRNRIESKAQGARPDTFNTNSWITLVFPVPQAISMTRLPLAHASRQSRWQGLSSCTSPVPSALGERTAALSLVPLFGKMLMRKALLVQNAAPNLDLRITCRGFSLRRNHLHPQTLIRIRVPCSSSLPISASSWYGLWWPDAQHRSSAARLSPSWATGDCWSPLCILEPAGGGGTMRSKRA